MREIKFRAWDKKNKAMVAWEQLLKHCDRLSVISLPAYEIMQFTGLKDKNGKEIYEGDVVTEGGAPHVIEYDEQRAAYNYKTKTGSALLYLFYGEVIGNIYENPELIAVCPVYEKTATSES